MGLIREVQNVGASLNKQERARRERERLKILQTNYTKELNEILIAEFTAILKQYDKETAEEITILKKDKIIEKLYNELYNRHYIQKGGRVNLIFLPSPPWDKKWKYEQEKEKVFLYRDFDIVTDLNDLYFKCLKTAQKDFDELNKIRQKQLGKELEKRFLQAFDLSNEKYYILLALQENKNIKSIVEDITTDETKQAILFDIYEKTLNKITKLYKGDIAKDKTKIKQQKEDAKNKNKKQLGNWLLFNYIMSDLLRSLPKAHNKKKKY